MRKFALALSAQSTQSAGVPLWKEVWRRKAAVLVVALEIALDENGAVQCFSSNQSIDVVLEILRHSTPTSHIHALQSWSKATQVYVRAQDLGHIGPEVEGKLAASNMANFLAVRSARQMSACKALEVGEVNLKDRKTLFRLTVLGSCAQGTY